MAAMMTTAGCGKKPDSAAQTFVARHLERVRPLEKASALAWWQANISGKPEDFQAKEKAENAVNRVLADQGAFAELKHIRERGAGPDEILKRSIDVLYLAYLGKQVDPKLLEQIVAKSNAVERGFNV